MIRCRAFWIEDDQRRSRRKDTLWTDLRGRPSHWTGGETDEFEEIGLLLRGFWKTPGLNLVGKRMSGGAPNLPAANWRHLANAQSRAEMGMSRLSSDCPASVRTRRTRGWKGQRVGSVGCRCRMFGSFGRSLGSSLSRLLLFWDQRSA